MRERTSSEVQEPSASSRRARCSASGHRSSSLRPRRSRLVEAKVSLRVRAPARESRGPRPRILGDGVDEAQLEGGEGIDQLRAEEHARVVTRGDAAGHDGVDARREADAERHLVQADLDRGIGRGDAVVAAQRHDAPAGDGVALDGRGHRGRVEVERRHEMLEALEEGAHLGRVEPADELEVQAGAEDAVAPREEHRAPVGFAQAVEDPRHHRRIEGVLRGTRELIS